MNFLSIFKYFPAILSGAQALQTSLPDAPGATKREILLSVLTAAGAIGDAIPEAHVQAIGAMIDAVVALLKKTGVFAPKAAAVNPPLAVKP